MPHLREQGDSLKGACTAKCSNFDFEKFENSIIPLEGACTPMRGNKVRQFYSGSFFISIIFISILRLRFPKN